MQITTPFSDTLLPFIYLGIKVSLKWIPLMKLEMVTKSMYFRFLKVSLCRGAKLRIMILRFSKANFSNDEYDLYISTAFLYIKQDELLDLKY